MRSGLLLAALCACSFEHGAVSRDAGSNATSDSLTDTMADGAPPAPCIQKWLAGNFQLGQLDEMDDLDTTSIERDPFLSPDELTIYFSSNRNGSLGMDIYRSTRSSITGSFGNAMKYASASTDADDSKMSMTEDGLYLVFASNKNGTTGSQDLLDASRAANTGSFSTPGRTYTAAVDTGADELDGFVTLDGLTLYLAGSVNGFQRIAVASRASRTVPFSAWTVIPSLDSGAGDADPTVSADGRVIIYASNRTGSGQGGTNLWYATRSSPSDNFGTPMPVPGVNSGSNDGDPWLSVDGCRLYFSTDRTGDYDQFVAAMQ